MKLVNKRRKVDRQLDGDDISIDAVIDFHCAVKAQSSHDQRVYIQTRRESRDIATFILIDSSLSSDSFMNNQRVLDVIKESVVVLSEVFKQNDDQFAIASFHSHTRHKCFFQIIKHFHQPWQACANRLMHVQADGYTRIGPAIRHATSYLEKTEARVKLLLLISDGKATDYDRYEGQYGMTDIRQALDAAHARGVRSYALAVTPDAKFYLPIMFGQKNYSILSTTQNLASEFFSIYRRML